MLRIPCCLAFAGLLASTPALGADLKIVVDGVDPAKGPVMVALFDSAEDFKNAEGSRDRAPFAARLTAGGPTVSLVITGLAPGHYAAAVFQDPKGTRKLEKSLFGIPTEPYGFSNTETSGRPPFDAAAVGPEGGTLLVRLRD